MSTSAFRNMNFSLPDPGIEPRHSDVAGGCAIHLTVIATHRGLQYSLHFTIVSNCTQDLPSHFAHDLPEVLSVLALFDRETNQ